MLNIAQVLDRLKISSDSRLAAVQDVREHIEASDNPCAAATTIVNNLTEIGDHTFTDPIVARMTAQYLVDTALLLGDKYDPNEALKKAARRIADHRVNNPWFFVRAQNSTVATTTETKAGVQVEVKTDGKMKKGGKQIVANALYAQHKGKSNAEIIAIFAAELDMSKAGATTYFYNAKKAAK